MASESGKVGTGKKVFVFVGMYNGLVSELRAFKRVKDAGTGFLGFTGLSYGRFLRGSRIPDYKLEDSRVYTLVLE